MISEQKVRVENPFGVMIFENFHFQKHSPIMLKRLAKKNFQYEMFNSNHPMSSKPTHYAWNLQKGRRSILKTPWWNFNEPIFLFLCSIFVYVSTLSVFHAYFTDIHATRLQTCTCDVVMHFDFKMIKIFYMLQYFSRKWVPLHPFFISSESWRFLEIGQKSLWVWVHKNLICNFL